MKRTALILAGAAVFDLGVMTVAAQAQQQTRPPRVSIPTTSTGPTVPGPGAGGAVVDPTGPGGSGGCTPGSPIRGGTANPCGPAAISDQAAAGNLTSFLSTAQPGGQTRGGVVTDHKGERVIYMKIDLTNTLQACTARGGQAVTHEGAQQCRIPAPAAPSVGNPTRRPGGIPPRN